MKSPVTKRRDVWTYIDYDLEDPNSPSWPLIIPPKTKSYGVRSLNSHGVESGGGPHFHSSTK